MLTGTRPRAWLVVALLLSAGLAVGAAVALVDARDDNPAPVRVSEPSPSPTVSPTPEMTPTPEAAAAPEISPTATASAASTTSAPPPSATASTSTKTYAYPRPSGSSDPLVLSATLNPGGGPSDTNFELTVKGTDGDGTVYFGGLTWGDGASVAAQSSPQRCKSYPPLTSPPGAYQPEPDKKTFVYHHVFPHAGRYVIKVTISSVNADCKPHGPQPETRSVELPVTVTQAAPTPSPLT